MRAQSAQYWNHRLPSETKCYSVTNDNLQKAREKYCIMIYIAHSHNRVECMPSAASHSFTNKLWLSQANNIFVGIRAHASLLTVHCAHILIF